MLMVFRKWAMGLMLMVCGLIVGFGLRILRLDNDVSSSDVFHLRAVRMMMLLTSLCMM
jgi:hypothetical protein